MGSVISDIIGKINPIYKDGPAVSHTLGYDSAVETLEPVYFFILDFMNNMGLSPEKLIDNFSSSPGSGHFSELGQRATIMQNQATKVLGDINTVLRSVLNIIYDLKEFKIRLQSYDDLKSPNKDAAILSLKQIWMDKVDIQKGNSSIKAMALGQSGFATLIDAFLVVKDETLKDASGKEIDLNDRVKRILIPRIHEFNIWVSQSEQELRKRYELEKTYLRSQVNSLKLYSRWAKPYLKAAYDLESKDRMREPALVKAFNTIILELVLIGKSELKVKDLALEGILPKEFAKENFTKKLRKYYSCVVVELIFRGIPQRVSQQAHFTFGGKADVAFNAYALNEDEIKLLHKELDKSDLDDVLKLINGTTDESLSQLQNEINFFLEEKKEDEKKEEKREGSNPFLALFGFYEKREKEMPKKKDEEENKPIRKDNWIEKTQLRAVAEDIAKANAMTIFDIYKSAHGMASFT
ncbi:MAG: hypothetical protein AABY32_05375 [Nanoarchaeota archaeon]